MSYKYQFQFNFPKHIIESNDPNIWISRWKGTREQVHLYELFYHEEVILFSAEAPFEVDEEADCDWRDWKLLHVGQGWGNEHEPYYFKGPISRQEAVDIIMDFLWQYNGLSNRGKTKVRSVTKSEWLQRVLNEELG